MAQARKGSILFSVLTLGLLLAFLFFVFFVVLFFSLQTQVPTAQTGTLSVQVLNAINNQGLQANIRIWDGSIVLFQRSLDAGQLGIFKDVPLNKSMVIQIQSAGFETVSQTVSLNKNFDSLSIALNPSDTSLSCTNECTINGEINGCASATAQNQCGQFDSDECLEYGAISCPAGQTCSAGQCTQNQFVVQYATCSELNGVICQTNQTCTTDFVSTSDTPYCCTGSCHTVSVLTCSDQGGTSCTSNQSCNGNFVLAQDTSTCCLGTCSETLLSCNQQNGIDCPLPNSCNGNIVPASDSASCCVGTCQASAQAPSRELFFNAYVNDGALHQWNGTGTSIRNGQLIPSIPALKAFGFKKFVVIGYTGRAKDLTTATDYFDDIEAQGVEVIPGFWLHQIFYSVPGWDENFHPPCNNNLCHSKNPWGLTDPAFYSKLEEILVIAGNSVQSRTVNLDNEFAILQPLYQYPEFWSDENKAIMRGHWETLAQHLKDQNIRLTISMPDYNPSFGSMVDLLTDVFGNSDSTPAYGFMQHHSRQTLFDPDKTEWQNDPIWTNVMNNFTSIGISDAGLAPGGVPYRLSALFGYQDLPSGWAPDKWRTHWITHPEIKSGGFSVSADLGALSIAANEFSQLEPLPPE